MSRLTTELVARCPQFTNPMGERELSLRSLGLRVIENLGILSREQFDCLDLSCNAITRVENVPRSQRLGTLLLGDNAIVRLAQPLSEQLPNLQTLVLTGNNIRTVKEVVECVRGCSRLTLLSLLENPVARKGRTRYRLAIVHALPSVRVLDFRKVTQAERKEAEEMYGGRQPSAADAESGAELEDEGEEEEEEEDAEDAEREKAADPEEEPPRKKRYSAEELRELLQSATTRDELARVEQLMRG